LAEGVKEVQRQFEDGRKGLHPYKATGGEPLYAREEVTGLVDATAKDLDQAIKRVDEPGLDGLRAWAAVEFEEIQSQVRGAPANAWLRAEPYPVARVASLAPFSLRAVEGLEPRGAPGDGAKPGHQGDLPKGFVERVLAGVSDTLGAIFVLAKTSDLQIDVEVSIRPVQGDDLVVYLRSAPDEKPQKRKQAYHPTNGFLRNLWRGIYFYRLERPHYPKLACPVDGRQDGDDCYLDLVRCDGPLVFDLARPTKDNPCKSQKRLVNGH
jgi:hypothetical protein